MFFNMKQPDYNKATFAQGMIIGWLSLAMPDSDIKILMLTLCAGMIVCSLLKVEQ